MVCGGMLGEKWGIRNELLIWKVLEKSKGLGNQQINEMGKQLLGTRWPVIGVFYSKQKPRWGKLS